jgi:hypothetical protein
MQFLPELELIDRLCIARVKYERTDKGNQDELDWYEARYQELNLQLTESQKQTLEFNIGEITNIHNQIWNLEWLWTKLVDVQLLYVTGTTAALPTRIQLLNCLGYS